MFRACACRREAGSGTIEEPETVCPHIGLWRHSQGPVLARYDNPDYPKPIPQVLQALPRY